MYDSTVLMFSPPHGSLNCSEKEIPLILIKAKACRWINYPPAKAIPSSNAFLPNTSWLPRLIDAIPA